MIFAKDTAFDVDKQWKILVDLFIVMRNTLPLRSLDIKLNSVVSFAFKCLLISST